MNPKTIPQILTLVQISRMMWPVYHPCLASMTISRKMRWSDQMSSKNPSSSDSFLLDSMKMTAICLNLVVSCVCNCTHLDRKDERT